jgi:hypothetical protein
VTATVAVTAPGAGTPTGTITVRSDNPVTDLCAITLPATSCNITLTTTGTKTLTATYEGDANFSTRTSAGVSHQVNSGGSTPTSASPRAAAGRGNAAPGDGGVRPAGRGHGEVTAGSGAAPTATSPSPPAARLRWRSGCRSAQPRAHVHARSGDAGDAAPYAVSVGYRGRRRSPSNGANDA